MCVTSVLRDTIQLYLAGNPLCTGRDSGSTSFMPIYCLSFTMIKIPILLLIGFAVYVYQFMEMITGFGEPRFRVFFSHCKVCVVCK